MKRDERNLYLSNMEVDEALALFFGRLEEKLQHLPTEKVKVTDSAGRVTAEAVFALLSSPNFNASAMDGIAVRATSTFGASEANPVRLVKGRDFIFVDTGDPIIDPYDAVIMIEEVVEIDDSTVEIIQAASPWQDIRPIGEDIVAHEMIIPVNHRIRPVDLAAMLAGGLLEVEVYKRPVVSIIPTGTEIVEPGSDMSIGKIIESNSRMFEGMTKEYGGEPNRLPPVPDEYEQLKDVLKKAVEHSDITLINAGSSAGSEDYTVKLIAELGEVLVHGIATKPGKPAILGIIEGKPVIGIPGYPVSAYFVFETFVKPLIMAYQHIPESRRDVVASILSKRLVSSLKHKEFVRVKLGSVDDKLIATPLSRGAGVSMSLVRADGILTIPQNSEGVEAGETVEVELIKPLEDINRTIVSIGSHDLAMDIIGSLIHRQTSAGRIPAYHLSSAHVGSMGGIMALKRGEAHLAPIHLLDEKTGIYNESYLSRYFKKDEMVLIKGIKRVQGMMVKPGNPKGIREFADISKEGIHFVNRQKGAGTRILTDYLFAKLAVDVSKIYGYDREMTTHMAVAAAVASGSADVGIGVNSAASAMGLDFIPIGDEDYDFAVPVKYLALPMLQEFMKVLKSKAFKDELESLGGYSTAGIGEVIYI